jgi:hypothetical protein
MAKRDQCGASTNIERLDNYRNSQLSEGEQVEINISITPLGKLTKEGKRNIRRVLLDARSPGDPIPTQKSLKAVYRKLEAALRSPPEDGVLAIPLIEIYGKH